MDRIEEIRARAEVATQGALVMDLGLNANFIIHSRTDIEYMLNEIDRLREENRWISVTERLPDHPFAVIICGPGYVSMESYINGRWKDQFSEITHWMERPKPPVAEYCKKAETIPPVECIPIGDGYFGIKDARGHLEVYAKRFPKAPKGVEQK